MTYQQMTSEILKDHPNGLTAQEILSILKEKKGVEISGATPTQTLYVALNRAEKKGLLKKEGNIWKL